MTDPWGSLPGPAQSEPDSEEDTAEGMLPELRGDDLAELIDGLERPFSTLSPDDPEFGFLPPISQGPLALLVLEDINDAWALEAPLSRMGWRTRARLGGDEALHAIHEEMPDLLVLKSWGKGAEGLTFLRVAKKFFPNVEKTVIAVSCGARGCFSHSSASRGGTRGQSSRVWLTDR